VSRLSVRLDRPASFKQHNFQRENLGVEETKGGNQSMPRGKLGEDLLSQFLLHEVEVEVGRGKTVLEAVKKIGVTEQT